MKDIAKFILKSDTNFHFYQHCRVKNNVVNKNFKKVVLIRNLQCYTVFKSNVFLHLSLLSVEGDYIPIVAD